MKILVLAEINDGELAEDQTSKTVSAATSLGKVDVLCASNSCTDASKKIASMANVEKVFVIEDDIFSQSLAESYSETLIDMLVLTPMYLRLRVLLEKHSSKNWWGVRCDGNIRCI